MAAATPSIVPALINFRREIDIDVIPKFEVVEPCGGSVWATAAKAQYKRTITLLELRLDLPNV